ncbi:EpsG family protein, partial [Psychrobacillus sp. FJAT-21963]|uniref:EpsG family protein n=1 Tax=Psychrobacillus sp. FJAT-21963 TaxID=1712028 RepID=UPI0006F6FBC0
MYYLLFFIGIILSFVKDQKRIVLVLFTLLLAVVAFFRYGVGADYFNYEYLFYRLDTSLLNEYRNGVDSQEIGFRLIGSFLKSIGLSYQQYLILFAIINLYFVSKTCKHYSENPVLSMLVYLCFYYFVWTFSGLRQGIALAVGIYYLLRTIENNKKIKFFVIVVVLSLIHSSAVLLLFLYFISMLKLSKKKLMLLAIISIMFSVLPVGNLLIKVSFIPFIDKLVPYVNTDITITNIFDFQSIGRLLFLVIIFIYYDAYSRKDDISKKI